MKRVTHCSCFGRAGLKEQDNIAAHLLDLHPLSRASAVYSSWLICSTTASFSFLCSLILAADRSTRSLPLFGFSAA
ncbi:hypothetical protein Syun_007064 [Stephania yunnanensis]|uniref:Uncharacterized protein n=1 Tax=Stephania yunnanensis TaxID=152371 RepID=A0AAP0KXV6_9MAGN